MPSGPRLLLDNSCYHIIARGNDKQDIFRDNKDYAKYLSYLKKYKRKYKFKIYGYCIMPNHVHIVGEIAASKGISKMMHGMQRAYGGYFNNRYGRVGYLWQGRFKSKVIAKDRYLINCINYIELNPVRAKIAESPSEYRWSSYKDRVLNINNIKMLDEINLF